MLKIEIDLIDDQELLTSFDFGNITFRAENTLITSKEGGPNMQMMIFLSLVELLDGLKKLFVNKKSKIYEFVGVGSGFIVLFEVKGSEFINIKNNKFGKTILVSKKELAEAIYEACSLFWSISLSKMPVAESIVDDYNLALLEFHDRVIKNYCK